MRLEGQALKGTPMGTEWAAIFFFSRVEERLQLLAEFYTVADYVYRWHNSPNFLLWYHSGRKGRKSLNKDTKTEKIKILSFSHSIQHIKKLNSTGSLDCSLGDCNRPKFDARVNNYLGVASGRSYAI